MENSLWSSKSLKERRAEGLFADSSVESGDVEQGEPTAEDQKEHVRGAFTEQQTMKKRGTAMLGGNNEVARFGWAGTWWEWSQGQRAIDLKIAVVRAHAVTVHWQLQGRGTAAIDASTIHWDSGNAIGDRIHISDE